MTAPGVMCMLPENLPHQGRVDKISVAGAAGAVADALKARDAVVAIGTGGERGDGGIENRNACPAQERIVMVSQAQAGERPG
jgi:hypothetical protein